MKFALSRIHLFIVVLVLVASLIRLGFVTRQSLWIDEAFTVSWCSESLPRMLKRIASEDRHPPLYCLLSYPIMHISNCTSCPFESAGKCEALVRLVSVISGSALILVTALIGTRIGGIACALLSACLLMVHPGAIHFSQDARPYMLHALLSALACLLWIDALKRRDEGAGSKYGGTNIQLSRYVALCIVSLLSLYSCYMAFVPWLARVLCASALLKRRKDRIYSCLVAADIIAASALMLWLAFVLSQPNVMGTKVTPTKTGIAVTMAFVMNDFVGYEYGLSHASAPILTLTLISSVACLTILAVTAYTALRNAARSNGEQSDEALNLMLVWLAMHLTLLFIAPSLTSEFNRWQRIIDGIVPLSLLLAYSAVHVHPAASSPFRRLITANARLMVAILLVLHCVGTYNQFHDSHYFREDWRGAAQFAMAHEDEFDFIVLNAPVGSLAFRLYYSGQRKFEDVPPLVTNAERKRASTWLQKLLSRHKRILVIECRSWLIDPTGWLSAQLERRARPIARWHSSKISTIVWEARKTED